MLEGRQAARKAGTFALSFFVYKVLAPLRIGGTVLLTPYVYRMWTGRDVDAKNSVVDERPTKDKD